MENLTTNDRIKHLISFKQLSISSFSREIGLINGVTISKIINQNRKPSSKTIGRIIKAFPDINYDWLINGEGEMLKNNISNSKSSQIQEDLTVTTKQIQDFMIARYDNGIADRIEKSIVQSHKDLQNFLMLGKSDVMVMLDDHSESILNKMKYYDIKVKQMEEAYNLAINKINKLGNIVDKINDGIEEIETYNLVEEVRKLKEISKKK